jgi:hypothetical protein
VGRDEGEDEKGEGRWGLRSMPAAVAAAAAVTRPLGSRRGTCDLSPLPSSVWRQTCYGIRNLYHKAKLLFLFRFPFRGDNAEERRLLCDAVRYGAMLNP